MKIATVPLRARGRETDRDTASVHQWNLRFQSPLSGTRRGGRKYRTSNMAGRPSCSLKKGGRQIRPTRLLPFPFSLILSLSLPLWYTSLAVNIHVHVNQPPCCAPAILLRLRSPLKRAPRLSSLNYFRHKGGGGGDRCWQETRLRRGIEALRHSSDQGYCRKLKLRLKRMVLRYFPETKIK